MNESLHVRVFASFARAAVMAVAFVATAMGAALARDGAQPIEGLVAEWSFQPEYALPGGAAVELPRIENPQPARPVLWTPPAPVEFLGESATSSYDGLLGAGALPTDAFAVELWMLNHVNRPVGALAGAFTGGQARTPVWAMGVFDGRVVFGAPRGREVSFPIDLAASEDEAASQWAGFKEHWHHLVGVWDGASVRLYHNGALVAEAPADRDAFFYPDDASFDISAFLAAEPHMAFENLVQAASLYDRALSADEVAGLFARRAALVEEGVLYENIFHFTAPPYLNAPTQTSMALVAETDQASRMRVLWGETTPLDAERDSAAFDRRHEFTLDGLKPDTAYFYEVVAVSEDGEEISSGLLTFRTAVQEEQPFTFAVFGDTEARPHINNKISQQIWGERPNFLMILGDLTDGGSADRRFEWTHEFFTGMGPLFGRVPTVAVPGNGESELHWYKHYHRFPGNEIYWTFTYGNAQFFMIDSDLEEREREMPGFRAEQREWLRQELARSTARWKIVAHHHPIYSSDEDDYGNSWNTATPVEGDADMRNDYLEIYEEGGVDLVLYGHMHEYERSWPILDERVSLEGGVLYMTIGGLGGNLEDLRPTRSWHTGHVFRGHHHSTVTISGDLVSVATRDMEGRLADTFQFVKGENGRPIMFGTAPVASR
jgi:predicted phosphodiesterase